MPPNETNEKLKTPLSKSEFKDLLSATGFVVCQFGPAKDDECEICGKDEIQQYYRRTCHESDEGEYYCIDCVKDTHEQNLKDLEGWADYAEQVST